MRWATIDRLKSGKAHLWRQGSNDSIWISECGLLTSQRSAFQGPEEAMGRCQKCERYGAGAARAGSPNLTKGSS